MAQYNIQETEKKLIEFWDKEGIYKFDSKAKKIFSIDTPPPTVSGKMHIGHAFQYSQMDFIARYKRMQGFSIFYPFGTDDNGLPTERLIEKEKKVRAFDLGREEFI
ncbi:MAG TPA: class I tRNA ligase family protein, partial [Candidatus Nanoarchaeia archaeon]|nr:class I tRNA ligase family protein [Candidatus Nanoarchaeia archaeon]